MRSLVLACLLLVPSQGLAEPGPCRKTCSWPERFFSGETRGAGLLRIPFLPARTLAVRSFGRSLRDGTLVLVQTIHEQGEKPRRREWRLKRLGVGRYAGTLSDAAGLVTGEVVGRRFHLRYTIKGAWAIRIEQWLDLEPGGKTARNRLTASRFGLPIASLRETIRKGP